MAERIQSHKNNKLFFKSYMSVTELNEIVVQRYGVYERTKRSYELETMDVKLKDLKNFDREDVEELRHLNKNKLSYKFYFSCWPDHLPKAFVLIGTLMLYSFWYGTASLIAFLPIVLVTIILLFFIRLTRGY